MVIEFLNTLFHNLALTLLIQFAAIFNSRDYPINGHGLYERNAILLLFRNNKVCQEEKKTHKKSAMAENRTRINCLEGNYADHYTTNALCILQVIIIYLKYISAGKMLV